MRQENNKKHILRVICWVLAALFMLAMIVPAILLGR